ncbi:MAG: MazG nucleotide pyrophosphohydrolase domain-containing protein [Aristaeellaceae bacterium]
MKHVVHIFGASGSGTTTLGRMLADEKGWTHLDTDDYYWLPTDPPFQQKRPAQDRVALMRQDMVAAENVVISGSLVDWGDGLIPFFTLCVRTVVEPSVRMERLYQRELARYGERILPGGDMHEANQAFLQWARGYEDGPLTTRSRALHDQWQQMLRCPCVTVDTNGSLEDALAVIRRAIENMEASTMDVNEYQRQAMTLLRPELTKRDALVNAVMGLCGESGETVDLVKKHLFQGHPLDREKLVKELGDVAWYLAEAATALDVPLSAILQGNLDKLHRRYPDGFTVERSLHRESEA